MACAYKHGKEKCGERSKESDTVRVFPEQFLGYLYHPVHASRGLQYTRAGNGGDDDVDNIRWWITRLEMEAENEYGKAYAGYGA